MDKTVYNARRLYIWDEEDGEKHLYRSNRFTVSAEYTKKSTGLSLKKTFH